MGVHFLHRHVLDNVFILEEGNLPQPWCPRCDMLVPWSALNQRHPATAQCARGSGEKEAAASGGGSEGEFGEGLRGIWEAARKCDGI